MPLPQAGTILTIVMTVGGGILIVFNWHSELETLLLFGIIFPAPLQLHRFWNETDWYARLSEFAHLMKDLVRSAGTTAIGAIPAGFCCKRDDYELSSSLKISQGLRRFFVQQDPSKHDDR